MKKFSQSPLDQSFIQNPYPAYEIARNLGDVVWWEDYNMSAAVSYRAVRMILSNRNLGVQALVPPQCPAHLTEWQANESDSMLAL